MMSYGGEMCSGYMQSYDSESWAWGAQQWGASYDQQYDQSYEQSYEPSYHEQVCSNLRVLNGVFQTVFFRCLTSAFDKGKPRSEAQRMPENTRGKNAFSCLLPSRILTTL